MTKRTRLLVLVALALAATTLAVAGAVLLNRNTLESIVTPPDEPLRSQQTDAWLEAVRGVSADGYWLVLRGYHATDNLVAAATNQPFSHVAILDVGNDRVIEAMAEGVRTMDLRERLHESHHVMVMRPRWWNEASGQFAIAEAIAALDADYDLFGTVGLGSRESFYCSELALHIYRAQDGLIPADERIPGVIEPGHMYLWGDIVYDSRWRN